MIAATILRQLHLPYLDPRDGTVATDVPGWGSSSHPKNLTTIEDELRNVELPAGADRLVGGWRPGT